MSEMYTNYNFSKENKMIVENTDTKLKILADESADLKILEQISWNLNKPYRICLLYTSPSPRDVEECRMPSSA